MSLLIKLFKSSNTLPKHSISCSVNILLRYESSKSNTDGEKKAEQNESIPVIITNMIAEDDDNIETEEEKEEKILKMRNKSRLRVDHRNILLGKVPYPEAKATYHNSVRYKRRLYARYGDESNVYPGICWPDKEELEDKKEFERVSNPLSIKEMVQIEKDKIKEAETVFLTRYNTIVEKVNQNPTIVKEFFERQKRKEQDAAEIKAQKEKLFADIRSHFGFNLNPHDEKFQEMVELKKKEEAKIRRLEKKKLREEKLITMALEMAKEGEKDVKKAGEQDGKEKKKADEGKPNNEINKAEEGKENKSENKKAVERKGKTENKKVGEQEGKENKTENKKTVKKDEENE